MNINNLIAHGLPLTGRHLIEASAGTGKTYNITRIYLRMLLERRLSVEQILVMTFTKDATEELRGRIDAFLRQALNQWQELVAEDEFFASVARQIEESEAKLLLRKALLFLDEAAIFTIHGFCKRVLSQHAFASGLTFNVQMEADCQDLLIEACQDWYRILASENEQAFLSLAEFWPDPFKFLSQFGKAIAHNGELQLVSGEQLQENFQQQARLALDSLQTHREFLMETLVDVKKGNDRQQRLDELEHLVQWLSLVQESIEQAYMPMPDAFIDGRRFSRSKLKPQLVEIFSPVNRVKTSAKQLQKTINKARAYEIVREGIYYIRQHLAQKKHQLNLLNFDDLISTLAKQLDKEADQALANVLYQQYPVALVDEFQDTDPQQFAILQAIYYQQAQAALYMIGDPKQAIYGFRGGDIFAYLSAREDCDHQWLMDTNWRSNADMVQGYNRLFYGTELPEKASYSALESIVNDKVFGFGIDYFPVKPSPLALNKERKESLSGFKALQFIHFDPSTEQGYSDKTKKSVKQSFRPVMANWCAREIVRLLSAGSVQAQDIAILVRDGAEADVIKQALMECDLAAVFLSNKANLFHSEQTRQLIALLKGILFVENDALFTAALSGDLLGYDAEKLYRLQQDELAWQQMKFTFIALRDEWLYQGFIGMALKLMHEHFRLAGQEQDRALTNLLHLFELLQSASQRHRQPQELLYWLEQEASADNPGSEAEQRLESDDNLIRIVTQHGSKGLEYPIVFVPFATRHKDPLRFGNKAVSLIEYHDRQKQLCLSLDGSSEAKKSMAEEAYAESIRLLYVAITRAVRRCYIFTAEFDAYYNSPLGRTLNWQQGTEILNALQALADENPDTIGVQLAQETSKNNYTADKSSTMLAEAACFKGKIERDWWLSSFSALSRNLRHGGVSTPDRDHELGDESSSALTPKDSLAYLLRFSMAKGAHTGNLLHDVLEHTDFSAPDWQASTKWPLVKYGDLGEGFTEQDLEVWLEEIIAAPLTQGGCLAEIPLAQTLRESEFYFPMNSANSFALAKLLTDHRNSYQGRRKPQHQLASRVQLPAYKKLKGMMHGFIDLVFCFQGRYYVCDYKSSHLGDSFEDYLGPALIENMEKNYYDLQYLIYLLALHRYLKNVLPDYDPDRHLGGVYYLYLRGMTNIEKYRYCGVFYRKVDTKELALLDEIFTGGKNEEDTQALMGESDAS